MYKFHSPGSVLNLFAQWEMQLVMSVSKPMDQPSRIEQPSRDVVPISDLTVLLCAKRSGSIFTTRQPNI